MKYSHQEKVKPGIAARSRKDIDAVNDWIDAMKGTICAVQIIRSGQGGPYQDTIIEARIFCHQPNVLTTNAPMVRLISREQALALARIFVGSWSDDPKFLEARLEICRPEPNPCGLEESHGKYAEDNDLHACWHVQIRQPYND